MKCSHLIALSADMGDHSYLVFRKEFCPKSLLLGHRRNEQEIFRVSVSEAAPKAHEHLVIAAQRKIQQDFPELNTGDILEKLRALESPNVPEQRVRMKPLAVTA